MLVTHRKLARQELHLTTQTKVVRKDPNFFQGGCKNQRHKAAAEGHTKKAEELHR